MADPEIKSYEPYHESQSAAVTESRPAQAVLMAIAFAFLGIFLLLPLIIVFHEALAKGISAYTQARAGTLEGIHICLRDRQLFIHGQMRIQHNHRCHELGD